MVSSRHDVFFKACESPDCPQMRSLLCRCGDCKCVHGTQGKCRSSSGMEAAYSDLLFALNARHSSEHRLWILDSDICKTEVCVVLKIL